MPLLALIPLGYFSSAILSYVFGDPQDFVPLFRAKYIAHLWWVRVHGLSAALVLLLGPVQFSLKPNALHRRLGQGYLAATAVAAITGFRLALIAEGGWSNRLGFVVLSGLWLLTGYLAWRAIRGGQVAWHQVWMIRNYGVALGAVTLRFYLYGLQRLGYSFDSIYAAGSWVCWTFTLLVVELLWVREPAAASGC